MESGGEHQGSGSLSENGNISKSESGHKVKIHRSTHSTTTLSAFICHHSLSSDNSISNQEISSFPLPQ